MFNKIYSDTCKRSFGATQVCRIAFRVWIFMQIFCREEEVAVWLNANMRFSGQWADAAENKGSPDPNLGILHWRFSLLGDWTTILTVWMDVICWPWQHRCWWAIYSRGRCLCLCHCHCNCNCHLDNIIVGEQNVAKGDVPVKDSLFCKVPQTTRHLQSGIRSK